MTPGPVGEVRRIVDRILAVPDRFTPESVSEACAVTLFEVACGNPYMREFAAYPEAGSFSAITFRGPAVSADRPPGLVITDASAGCRIAQADLASCFRLSSEQVGVNPRIPPEGVVSFWESHGPRTLYLQFTAGSRMLRAISVHETS
ncbi:hypothetical protein [Nocardia brevicatena]|uniref:hypothetical protein n=1 Tax=Nocardia brevicatena TaxID=37327 RepID=UPI0002D966AB|nr:hypothetical protein [Nocardia brevicatena]